MKFPAVLLAMGFFSALQAQSQINQQSQSTFIIPRVDVTRPGLNGVTRPTLMGGFGNAVGGAGGLGGNAGLAVNPNVIAARALFSPILGNAGSPNAAQPVAAVPVVASAPVYPKAPDAAESAARLLAYHREQAKSGSPSAQYALAMRYRTGDGFEADPRLSRIWMEAAARNGSDEAAHALESAKSVAAK